MAHRRTSHRPQLLECDPDYLAEEVLRTPVRTRIECLQQLLWAVRDIADHDDIHQAAERLALVQDCLVVMFSAQRGGQPGWSGAWPSREAEQGRLGWAGQRAGLGESGIGHPAAEAVIPGVFF